MTKPRALPRGNQYFLLPPQPDPTDKRPRNAFGFLIAFGAAVAAHHQTDRKDVTK